MPSPSQENAAFLTIFDGELYFRGRGPSGATLFRTDGMAVDDVMGLSNASPGISVVGDDNNYLYFEAQSLIGGTVKRGLFKTNGDSAGFIDANQGNSYDPQNALLFKDSVYFTTVGPHGEELFMIRDGVLTEFDINPNGSSSPSGIFDCERRVILQRPWISGTRAV